MPAALDIVHGGAHIASEVLDLVYERVRNNIDELFEAEPKETENIPEKSDNCSAELLGSREQLFKGSADGKSERRYCGIQRCRGIALLSLRLFLRRLALFALLRLGLFGGVCFCFDFVRLNHDIFVLGRVRVIPVNLTSRLLHGRSCAPVESLFVCGKDIVIVAVKVYLLKKIVFLDFTYSVFRLAPVLYGRLRAVQIRIGCTAFFLLRHCSASLKRLQNNYKYYNAAESILQVF